MGESQLRSANRKPPYILWGSVALFMLNLAINATVNKYGSHWSDLVIVFLWILPIIPFAIWGYLHERTLMNRIWLISRFRNHPISISLVILLFLWIAIGQSLRIIHRFHNPITAASAQLQEATAKPKVYPQKEANSVTPHPANPIPRSKSHLKLRPQILQSPSVVNPPTTQTTYEQKCEGSACAQGPGSQATFNQYSARDWEAILDGEKQQSLSRALKQAQGKVRLTWLLQDVDGMKMASFLNAAFIQAQWTTDEPENYAGNMCYPTLPSDCLGLYITVKDRNSKLAQTAINAISAFIPNPHIAESDKVPNDRVEIFIAKAKY